MGSRSISIFLTSLITCLPLVINAAESKPESTTQAVDWQKEVQNIDSQIEALTTSLAKLRKDALNAEVKSQPQMIDSWHQFLENIRLNEEDEKQIQEIKKQIKTLVERKKALLKSHSQK